MSTLKIEQLYGISNRNIFINIYRWKYNDDILLTDTNQYIGVSKSGNKYKLTLCMNDEVLYIGTNADARLLAEYYDALCKYYNKSTTLNFKESFVIPLSINEAKQQLKELNNKSKMNNVILIDKAKELNTTILSIIKNKGIINK